MGGYSSASEGPRERLRGLQALVGVRGAGVERDGKGERRTEARGKWRQGLRCREGRRGPVIDGRTPVVIFTLILSQRSLAVPFVVPRVDWVQAPGVRLKLAAETEPKFLIRMYVVLAGPPGVRSLLPYLLIVAQMAALPETPLVSSCSCTSHRRCLLHDQGTGARSVDGVLDGRGEAERSETFPVPGPATRRRRQRGAEERHDASWRWLWTWVALSFGRFQDRPRGPAM